MFIFFMPFRSASESVSRAVMPVGEVTI